MSWLAGLGACLRSRRRKAGIAFAQACRCEEETQAPVEASLPGTHTVLGEVRSNGTGRAGRLLKGMRVFEGF